MEVAGGILIVLLIILGVIVALITFAAMLGVGLFGGIFPATFLTIRDYYRSVLDNVQNKFVKITIIVVFSLFVLALLVMLTYATLKYVFGVDIFPFIGG